MKTTIHEKRASEEYARKVFEKLYQDEIQRKACARLLADSILFAHSLGPSCWTVTLFANEIRLNVGQVEVLVLRSNDVFLVIAEAASEFRGKEYYPYLQPSGIHYRSVPIGQSLCHIPPMLIEKIYPQISEYHRKFIRHAASRRKVTTWKSSFSAGVILFLENWLNIPLPMPEYIQSLSVNHINTKGSTSAPKGAKFLYQWESELRKWINRSRNIEENLTESYIRFFALAFENTRCPERAWFGIHDLNASIVVGNIFLAAVIKSGENRGIWLLLKDPPRINGWQSWNTKSTQTSSNPLQWFHTPRFEKIVDILDNSNIWQSYRSASAHILNFQIASDRDDVQKRRGKLRLSTFYLAAESPLVEIEKYRSSYESLQETERQAVIQSRIGQGKFRSDLVQYWGKCAVTGCQKVELLRASHIKPWREASNQERLDMYNGLLLVPSLDAAFDAGYISFANDGSILISRSLSDDDQNKLGIHSDLRISKLTEEHIKYLQYHRKHIFRDRDDAEA